MPHITLPLGEAELDEAELGARLALHQLGADTSERIELTRTPTALQVRGIVATDTRKREIEASLHMVPHVVADLYTFHDLQEKSSQTEVITSVKSSSTVETPSPLETYLLPKGISRDAIGELGHQLFTNSVQANQEGKAIADLERRFATSETLTVNAQAALHALIEDHRRKLLAALQREETLLSQAKLTPGTHVEESGVNGLAAAAQRNASLCSELISDGGSRPAQAIVPELAQSIRQLRDLLAIPSGVSSAGSVLSPSTAAAPPNN